MALLRGDAMSARLQASEYAPCLRRGQYLTGPMADEIVEVCAAGDDDAPDVERSPEPGKRQAKDRLHPHVEAAQPQSL
jgi:hypothetical protein